MEETKLKETTNIYLELDYPYAIIRIDREDNNYNTLIPSMISEMDGILNKVERDDKIRVLILTGNDRVFSTGVDVSHPSIYEMDPMQARYFSKLGKIMFGRLEQLDIPTIAAVNGTALGGGLEICLTCDFRIASERAMFGLPESNLGIIPGWGGTQRLLKHIGYAKALEMILAGNIIKAREAYEAGLIQELVPKGEDVVEAAKKWSERFTTRSSVAIAMCKKAVRMAAELPLKYGEEFESELFGMAWASKHREIGIEAFRNREKPEFPADFG